MKELRRSLLPVFLIATCIPSLASCGQQLPIPEAMSGPEIKSTTPPEVEDVSVSSEPLNWNDAEFEAFTKTVQGLMRKRDFASLDAAAADFRAKKERFQKGGGWKIHSFYSLTSAPAGDTEEAWKRHIQFLETWKAKMPTSMAARVSLAEALLAYAWKARGVGYAHEVSPDGLRVFKSRIERTGAELLEASKLEERCYGYFEILLDFARGGGFQRDDFDRTFADAMAYDKTYQYFYIRKAEYLLPRWFGAPGEVAEFAESLLDTPRGDEGFKLYYLLVAELANYKSDTDVFKSNGLSWRKVKKGFVLFERDNGMTRYRLNQFGNMTTIARDAQAACNTFKRLQGENDFDPGFWNSREIFEAQKRTALDFMCKVPKFDNQSD